AAPATAAPAPAATPAAPAPRPSGVVLRTLTEEEQSRRAHALGDARLREAEERKIAEEEAPKFRRGPGGAMRPAAPPQRPTRAAKTATERPRGRLTLVTALSADEVRERSEASFRRRERRRTSEKSNEPREKLVREVTIPEAITIQELANRMAERAVDVIKIL